MIDSTTDSGTRGDKELIEVQSASTTSAWVKPTLERLSLKQALAGNGSVPESGTVGS